MLASSQTSGCLNNERFGISTWPIKTLQSIAVRLLIAVCRLRIG
jgi:hypothetical protein